jgi:hypothetical protein
VLAADATTAGRSVYESVKVLSALSAGAAG